MGCSGSRSEDVAPDNPVMALNEAGGGAPDQVGEAKLDSAQPTKIVSPNDRNDCHSPTTATEQRYKADDASINGNGQHEKLENVDATALTMDDKQSEKNDAVQHAAAGSTTDNAKEMGEEIEVLDKEMALNQVGGDEEFLLELIHDVLNERETHLATLEAALQESDYKSYRVCGHTIKGSALNVGLNGLGRWAQQMEKLGDSLLKAAESDDNDQLSEFGSRQRPQVEGLKRQYERVDAMLKDGI